MKKCIIIFTTLIGIGFNTKAQSNKTDSIKTVAPVKQRFDTNEKTEPPIPMSQVKKGFKIPDNEKPINLKAPDNKVMPLKKNKPYSKGEIGLLHK